MPRTRELAIELLAPTEGLNLAVDETQLGDKESVDIGGFELDEYGLLSVPFPDKDLGAPAGTSQFLAAHMFVRPAAETQLIAQFSDGSLRYSTNFDTAGTATWTTISASAYSGGRLNFVTAFGYVYFCNGSNDLSRWDGSTLTTYASAPKVQYLKLWKDTLWGAGVSANPDRVYRSAPGDGTTWGALDFIDVEKGAGRGISALLETDTALIVFKYQKIHAIYDPVEFFNRIVDNGKGCIADRTVVVHRDKVYYLSHFGICRFYSDGPGEVISKKIEPLFTQFLNGSGGPVLDWSVLLLSAAWSYQNYVAFFLYANTGLVKTLLYYPDLPGQPWFYAMDTAHGSRICIPKLDTTVPELYAFDYPASSAHIWRRYDPAATATINAYWYTRWFDFGDPFTEKLLYEMRLVHRGVLAIEYEKDYVKGALTSMATDTSAATSLSSTAKNIEVYGRAFRIRVKSTTNPGATTQLTGGGIYNTPLTLRRYQAAISRIIVKARRLGNMAR